MVHSSLWVLEGANSTSGLRGGWLIKAYTGISVTPSRGYNCGFRGEQVSPFKEWDEEICLLRTCGNDNSCSPKITAISDSQFLSLSMSVPHQRSGPILMPLKKKETGLDEADTIGNRIELGNLASLSRGISKPLTYPACGLRSTQTANPLSRSDQLI